MNPVSIGRATLVEVGQFACLCGARSEGMGDPPACWACGGEMHQWAVRKAEYAPFVVVADRADTRTSNGGY